VAVYSPALHFDFLNYDDPAYVTSNPIVRHGLSWAGLVWALSFHAANWFPLTWLSHMADCQWFGMRPGWHHATNVVLHTAAALLLFAALNRLTRALWPSAFAAFLFALHPLHVESVAWVAERKDVLCAVFWFLALWCYARYVERPGAARYLAVLTAFGLALMAKPMIVTLPFLLLLLDIWPLRRANMAAVREKIPLFALAAAASVATFLAQQQGRAVRSLASMPLGVRVENALVAYAAYLGRIFRPGGLAVFYPYQAHLSVWQVAGAACLLAGVTAVVIRQARTRPYLAVGWFWYVGTLVPVIGLVQVGGQASADRYTYVPLVGVAIMLAWGAAELAARHPGYRTAIAAASALACVVCMAITARQLSYWSDSEQLFQHAIAVTRDNTVAHNNLADYYLVQERNREAAPHVEEALRIEPNYPEAHANLALLLRRAGKFSDAEREYRLALALQPANGDTHSGYAVLLAAEGRTADALREMQTAVELRPDYADGHLNLGRALAALGRGQEALAQYDEAVRLMPDNPDSRHTLGFALLTRGRMNEALAQFAAESRLRPDDANLHVTVGSLLAGSGRYDEAIAEFTEALQINPGLAAARSGLETARARKPSAGR
jgi:tetratricopeptide (TPR) repeat protein